MLNVVLHPHQQYIIEKVKNKPKIRLMLAHATGTGKTVSMLALSHKILTRNNRSKKILVITPASLKTNFIDTVKMFSKYKIKDISSYDDVGAKMIKEEKVDEETGEKKTEVKYKIDDISSIKNDDNDIHIISYDMFRNIGEYLIDSGVYDAIIVDEAHNLRNPKSRLTQAVLNASQKVPHVILASGSIINNRPEEFGVYLKILNPEKYPYDIDYKKFKEEFIQPLRKSLYSKKQRAVLAYDLIKGKVKLEQIPPVYNLKNINTLLNLIREHFDYIDIESFKKKLPAVKEENILVNFSPEQEEYFRKYINTDFKELYRLRKEGAPPEVIKQKFFITFSHLRQMANSPRIINPDIKLEEEWKHSPKLKKMIEDIKQILSENENNTVVVYGNFVKHGILPLYMGLLQNGIEAVLFTGEQGKRERDEGVKKFKNKEVRVILLSPAGCEGLSLNTANYMLIMDPHPNPEKQKQAEARIIRLNSIPREVNILRYFAVPSKPENKKLHLMYGPDIAMFGLAKYKEVQQKPVKDLLSVSKNPKVAVLIQIDPKYRDYYELFAMFYDYIYNDYSSTHL